MTVDLWGMYTKALADGAVLMAENAELRRLRDAWQSEAAKDLEVIAELRAQVAGLAVDAERYRWLRKRDVLAWERVLPCKAMFETSTGKNLDANIDRANKEQT